MLPRKQAGTSARDPRRPRHRVLRRLRATSGSTPTATSPTPRSTAAGCGCTRRSTTDDAGQAVDAVQSTRRSTSPIDPSAALVVARRPRAGAGDGRRQRLRRRCSQVNLAVGADGGGAGRQAGSSFKPFALAEALDPGHPAEHDLQRPGEDHHQGADDGKDWKSSATTTTPASAPSTWSRPRPSRRTPSYAQLVQDIGPRQPGRPRPRDGHPGPLTRCLSLVLGTGDVSLLDMASAYSTFADEGEHVEPVRRHPGRPTPTGTCSTSSDGKRDPGARPEGRRPGQLRPQPGDRRRHRHRRQDRPAGGRQDRHHRGLPTTPGSSATRCTAHRRRCGWATPTNRAPHGRRARQGGRSAAPSRRRSGGKFMAKATEGLQSCPYDRPDGVSGRVGAHHRHDHDADRRSGSTTTTGPAARPPRPRHRTRPRPRCRRRPPPRRPPRRPPPRPGAGRPTLITLPAGGGQPPALSRGLLDDLVGVVGAAHEAPLLEVTLLDACRACPRPRG